MLISRRRFLHHIGWLAAATAARGIDADHAASQPPQLLDTRALARFVDPLPIPAVAKPSGQRSIPADPPVQALFYRMVMRQFQARVHRDMPPTTFWGYNGSCPGPTIEARRGMPLLVEWMNDLPRQHLFPIDHSLNGAEAGKPEVRTVVHLHGGRTPPSSDGYPEDWFVTGQ